MAKYDNVTHPDKILASLYNDDAIRRVYKTYLTVEDSDKLVSFNVFGAAVIRAQNSGAFSKYTQELNTENATATSKQEIWNNTKFFFRKVLCHETNGNS